MKTRLAATVALLPALAIGALNTNEYPFAREIRGPSVVRTEVVAATLDAAVCSATADGFSDLRIVDDRGVEVPFAVEKVVSNTTRIVRIPVPSRPIALKELPGNRIEAEFELADSRNRADGLEIRTPLRDFVRAVSVEGSADGTVWKPLAPSAEIFDYGRYLDIRRTDIAVPANDCTRFRVAIGNASEDRAQPIVQLVRQDGGQDAGAEIRTQEMLRTPFRMDGVGFWRNEPAVERSREIRREWELPAPQRVEHSREKTTEITVATARRPLNRLTVTTGTKNFSRKATVRVPVVENGVAGWRDVAAGRLTSVELPGCSEHALSLDFPEQRATKIRVVIANGDNPPLTGLNLAGEGPVHRILLLAETGRTYRLLYGAPEADAPTYDLSTVLAPLRTGLQPAAWEFGATQANATYRPAGRAAGWLNSPYLLTGVIILAALVLLGILARSLKSVGRRLDGDDEPPP